MNTGYGIASNGEVIVPVEAHPVGESARGEWCDRCALPSMIAQPFVMVHAVTLAHMGRYVWRCCVECGDWETEAQP